MLSTAVSILATLALLMPGFIIAELGTARGARSSRSDLELALRSLAYTLILHLTFCWWTVRLVERVGKPDEWADHVGALALYAAVVLLAVPVVVGMLTNRYLARAEQRDGQPPLLAAALGAGEARDAFDYAFQRLYKGGAYVVVELVGHTSENPRLIGGIYGERSAIGQTPAPHDIYLETAATATEDEDGVRSLVNRLEGQSLYIPAAQIVRVDLLLPQE